MNCPHCNSSFEEEYNFCPNCEQQIKCVNCQKPILLGKSKCLYCGTILGSPSQSQETKNTFSLEEHISAETRSRKIDLKFTDSAINSALPILNAFASSRLANDQKTAKFLPSSSEQAIAGDLENVELNLQVDNTTTSSGNTSSTTQVESISSSDTFQAKDYFELDTNGFLISHQNDYKGTTKLDQQQRFSLLYVEAYFQIMGTPVPNRTHLNSAAKKNKIHDSNFPANVTKIIGKYIVHTDGQLKLNPAGKRQLEVIINDMQNNDVVGFQSRTRGSTKRVRTNKSEKEKIAQWVKMPSRLDSFDTRNLNETLHWCLFAVHDITKELQVDQAVKPSIAYEYISRKHKKITTTKDAFVKAFSRDYNKKFLAKSADGTFFLTTEGEAHINQILSGSTLPSDNNESDSDSQIDKD